MNTVLICLFFIIFCFCLLFFLYLVVRDDQTRNNRYDCWGVEKELKIDELENKEGKNCEESKKSK